ncbi:LysR family transcriptional regulator [Pseudomonas baetica]|uniref:LysR family transcriptional regulator n=1 Tax=Pseudomonas baetica TaxID=674054 RepID=UPI003EE9F937
MNTRQLHHFVAVMDTGSLSAAAEAVHLSIPALSRSLKALEDELRVSLFDRSNRRLRPTPYALEYLDRARRIVFDEREGARALSLMKNGAYGPLAFGLGSSLAVDLLAPLINELIAHGPNLRVQAQVESTNALLDSLRKEKLDFFVGDVSAAASSSDLLSEPLYKCTYGWFVRHDHPLANKKKITISELENFPIIGSGYISDTLAFNISQLYGWQLPLEKNFSVNINNLETIHKLLSSSHMISPSTYNAMHQPLKNKTVVALDVYPPLKLDMTLGIVRLAFRTLVPSTEHAFEIIRNYFVKLDKEIANYII